MGCVSTPPLIDSANALPYNDLRPFPDWEWRRIIADNPRHMISEKTLATLELHKILQDLTSYTTFGAGEEFAIELFPSTELEEVQLWQRETAEAVALLEERSNITVRGARDVREPVIKAQRGVIVEPSILLDIRYTLRRGSTLKRTLGRMGMRPFPCSPSWRTKSKNALNCRIPSKRRSTTTPRSKTPPAPAWRSYAAILKVAFDRLQNKLNRIVANKANQDKLQEAIVTMRNGRYVVPLKAEHKGKIKGILHDSSASGATIFIEPLETVELNNKWRELQVEEEKEIRRILADLTDEIAGESERIVRTVQLLGYLDLTFAKARYAIDNNCVQPKMAAIQPAPKRIRPPGHDHSTQGGAPSACSERPRGAARSQHWTMTAGCWWSPVPTPAARRSRSRPSA